MDAVDLLDQGQTLENLRMQYEQGSEGDSYDHGFNSALLNFERRNKKFDAMDGNAKRLAFAQDLGRDECMKRCALSRKAQRAEMELAGLAQSDEARIFHADNAARFCLQADQYLYLLNLLRLEEGKK